MRHASAALIFATLLMACGNSPTESSVAESGFRVEITSLSHDSTGYSFAARATNTDTEDLGIGGCSEKLEVLRDGAWTSLEKSPVCPLWAATVNPGGQWDFTLPYERLVQGEQVQVGVSWSRPGTPPTSSVSWSEARTLR